jgi:ABC-type protease/lipase transport system fused ATPase/permease subunit
MVAAAFSLLLNLPFLAPAIYMLQVYDRVPSTGVKRRCSTLRLVLRLSGRFSAGGSTAKRRGSLTVMKDHSAAS